MVDYTKINDNENIVMKTKKAYNEIFKVLKKHSDLCVFDINYLQNKADKHLFALELKDVFGLNIKINQIDSLDWNRFGDYMSIGKWGEKYNRTISWSVDGKQPKDELLLKISFPTGAFIFGTGEIFDKDYPIEFFKKFWAELKNYKPDYIDEKNSSLYWNIKNAKNIFNSFNKILNKYHELNKKDIKLRKIKKMKEELGKMESEI